MRAYSAASEEALLAGNFLNDWAGEGFLTNAQYRRMEQDTACELRRTNLFPRFALFLFTLLIAGAATGLFFVVFLSNPAAQTTGIFLLVFAAVFYAGAEVAVSQAHLYHHGIDEALAACSVGFLCAGLYFAFFSGRVGIPNPYGMEFLVPAAGCIASLWVWHRFGLSYAFLAAMVFVPWLPGYWTSSHAMRHLIVASFYAVGLAIVATVRARNRVAFLDRHYSLAQAMLWLGIYLAVNLQLSSVSASWLRGSQGVPGFSRMFYWVTWVLIWCLPSAILWRGMRRKDRFVMAAGTVAAVLTLVTNKPYLGWQRHSWDPMLLGLLLIGIALFLRRWLARGHRGIRHGFTAQRLSGKDKQWIAAGSTAFGVVAPQTATFDPQPAGPGVQFGGGESGGGGASSDF